MYIKDYPFPSPIGELHFSIPSGTRPRRTHQGFRPLSGSYISQFETLNGAVYKPANVSVPYRGATFLNDVEYKEEDLQYSVSVPYRGATFLNRKQQSCRPGGEKFPSPIGELHFSMGITTLYQCYHLCFRPLSGSYISQSYTKILEETTLKVSVPYRGATFLNTISATPCPVWDE